MDASCRDVHDPCWSTYIDEVVAHPENYACLLDSTGALLLTTDESKIRRRSKRCVNERHDYLLFKLSLSNQIHALIEQMMLLPKVLGLSPKIVFGQKMKMTIIYVVFMQEDGTNAM